MDSSIVSIIMAGGLGKRMSSTKSKVLHEVNGFPMIYHVIQNALAVHCERIFIVVGKYKYDIADAVGKLFSKEILDKIVYVNQPESILEGELCSLGTGDAVRACLTEFDNYDFRPDTRVLILSGDVPFLDRNELLEFSKRNNSIMVANVNDPTGYGRIFINECGNLSYIAEHALCDDEQLRCTFVNAGVYNLSMRVLRETIPKIELNTRKMEFLLTDFYLFTDKPIHIFFTSGVPKNINTLTDLLHVQSEN